MTTRVSAWLLLLACTTSACAPRARMVSMPVVPSDRTSVQGSVTRVDGEVWRRLAAQLPPAARVRLRLTDGTRLDGVIDRAAPDVLLVKPKARLPEPPRSLPYSTIESLELDAGRGIGLGKALAIGIGAGAATFVGLMLVAVALISD